jgi:CubicO group peptidase (beta-lactamase class C family)
MMTVFFRTNRVIALLLGAAVFLLISGPVSGAKTEPVLQINYDPVKEAVSQLIQREMKKNDIVGLSIVLVDGQRLIWAQGFGYADERKDITATPETVYRIGSLTKLFTASAVMRLAEQSKLSIDKPLQTYLAEFSIRTRFDEHAAITPRNMMTHHSGLPTDYQKGMWSKNPDSFTTVTDLLKDEYMAYPPELIFSYSNIGYDLLGHVIERITGQDYALHIQSTLLHPLGMRHSGFTPPAASRLMSAGYFRGTEMEDPALRDIPAGGMYSTVLDLSRFIKMIFANGAANDRQILAPGTVAEMLRPQNTQVPLDLGLRVGLGWMLGGLGEIDILNAGPVAHHAGATLLFRSQMIILPRHKLGVVVLSNSSTAGRPAGKIAEQALELALEAKTGIKQPLPEKSPEIDVVLSPEIQKAYAGNYASLVGLAEITSKSGSFNLEALNRTFQLVPHASGKFGAKYVFLGLFPFSLAALDIYEVSHAKIAGHEILRASTKGNDLLIAEKIKPMPVPAAWRARVGRYTIENLGGDIAVFENIRLLYDNGWLVLECSMPFFFKSTFRFPLKPASDTEAILAGLGGRSMGDTIRIVTVNGKEKLAYSGYLLRKDE